MTSFLKPQQTVILPDVKSFNGKRFDTKGFYLGPDFREHFLNKEEKNIKGVTFKVSELQQPSLDRSIIRELGGEEKAEVALAHVYEFLKQADKVGGYVFYVRDTAGTLWTVYVYWLDYGWLFGAGSIDDPEEWGAGDRRFVFVSRDSGNSEPSLEVLQTLPLEVFEPVKSTTQETSARSVDHLIGVSVQVSAELIKKYRQLEAKKHTDILISVGDQQIEINLPGKILEDE